MEIKGCCHVLTVVGFGPPLTRDMKSAMVPSMSDFQSQAPGPCLQRVVDPPVKSCCRLCREEINVFNYYTCEYFNSNHCLPSLFQHFHRK